MNARRWTAVPLASALTVGLLATAPASAAPAGINLMPSLTCADTGGAEVDLTIRNDGRTERRLVGDFHLFLTAVRKGGLQPLGALFVFPAPGFNVIPAGEERTFILTFGTASPEAEEPGVDLSARRLLLVVEVFVDGRDHKIERTFTFTGCPPLT